MANAKIELENTLVKLAIADTINIVNKHHPITNEKVGEAISNDLIKWMKYNAVT